LGSEIIHELESFGEGSRNPTTKISTPKCVEEVIIEVMQVDKTIELFQTMAIVSLNMENLNLEVNNLRNKLTTKEKEKKGSTSRGIGQGEGLLEGVQA
jgi:hypothetical protein